MRSFAEFLASRGACRESVKWVGSRSAGEAWRDCERADWAGWLLDLLLPEQAQRLAYRAADRAVRIHAPAALEAADLPTDAATLQALAPITDLQTAEAALVAAGAARAVAARLADARITAKPAEWATAAANAAAKAAVAWTKAEAEAAAREATIAAAAVAAISVAISVEDASKEEHRELCGIARDMVTAEQIAAALTAAMEAS